MDIKSKSYSHSIITKIIFFIIAIICFTGAIFSFLSMVSANGVRLDYLFKDSYYESSSFAEDVSDIMVPLQNLSNYRSEEYITSGGTVTEEKISNKKNILYSEFEMNSPSYDPNLSYEENYAVFEVDEAEKIAKIKDDIIAEDLYSFKEALDVLNKNSEGGLLYYYSDGESVFSNTELQDVESFKKYPAYVISERGRTIAYPHKAEIALFNSGAYIPTLDQSSSTVYIGFDKDYIESKVSEFEKKRSELREDSLQIAGFLMGLFVSFIYLVVTVGRNSFRDEEVHLNRFDKLYNDINLFLCLGIIGIWMAMTKDLVLNEFLKVVIPATAALGSIGLILVLTMVKHIKNKTFFKNTLVYQLCFKLFSFFRSVYNSGSIAVKVVSVAVLYPLIVGLTFFMFPITIGIGVWFAYKKAQEFIAISDGVAKIKSGDIDHSIELQGDGEFKKLADNINSIKDGLGNAIENELKSERMKTELITNVSHDIRTPLTSIITYIDLLKRESDESKCAGYLDVIDQKSQRLKMLTDDLFEAAKASSGNMPVSIEKIDIVSLLNQGLGELSDKVGDLEFKLSSSKDKLFVAADGKLLWRSIENLLSNVFKYALKGSRVYVDFVERDSEVSMTIKNISAYELNITAEELMERFKRGDDSRSSEGSGLGLSIARSLVEMQCGHLDIDIDGDLFKATVVMPKFKH